MIFTRRRGARARSGTPAGGQSHLAHRIRQGSRGATRLAHCTVQGGFPACYPRQGFTPLEALPLAAIVTEVKPVTLKLK